MKKEQANFHCGGPSSYCVILSILPEREREREREREGGKEGGREREKK